MSNSPKLPRPPWLPANCDYYDVVALQHVARGIANPDEQVRALAWIVAISRTHNDNYYPQSSRDTDYAQGMRKVGLEILRLVNMPGEEMEVLKARLPKNTEDKNG